MTPEQIALHLIAPTLRREAAERRRDAALACVHQLGPASEPCSCDREPVWGCARCEAAHEAALAEATAEKATSIAALATAEAIEAEWLASEWRAALIARVPDALAVALPALERASRAATSNTPAPAFVGVLLAECQDGPIPGGGRVVWSEPCSGDGTVLLIGRQGVAVVRGSQGWDQSRNLWPVTAHVLSERVERARRAERQAATRAHAAALEAERAALVPILAANTEEGAALRACARIITGANAPTLSLESRQYAADAEWAASLLSERLGLPMRPGMKGGTARREDRPAVPLQGLLKAATPPPPSYEPVEEPVQFGLPSYTWKLDHEGVWHTMTGEWHGIVDPRNQERLTLIVNGTMSRWVLHVPYPQPLDEDSRAKVLADAKTAVEGKIPLNA